MSSLKSKTHKVFVVMANINSNSLQYRSSSQHDLLALETNNGASLTLATSGINQRESFQSNVNINTLKSMKSTGNQQKIEDTRPQRTAMDSFMKSSFVKTIPQIGFGTAARPSLVQVSGGPGYYPIKTTLGKVFESNIVSPGFFSMRSRTSFGDPYAKATSKTLKNEPGPSHYNLDGKFTHGRSMPEISFPKAVPPKEKPEFGPAPGQYKILESMGKQPISTKRNAPGVLMPKAPIKSTKPINDIEVGPGEYGAGPAAFEKQLQSTKRSCPQVKFGPGYRRNGNIQKPELFEPSPTPYSYQLPGSIATQLKGTPYRNAPAPSLSGRVKFGSPW